MERQNINNKWPQLFDKNYSVYFTTESAYIQFTVCSVQSFESTY